MSWWDASKPISSRDRTFSAIIEGLVFNCPSCTIKKTKNGQYPNGKTKYKEESHPVSARGTTFRSRGVCKDLLVTVLAQIRRPFAKYGTYSLLKNDDDVEKKVDQILDSSSLTDPNFELIVFKKCSTMSDTEALYYYIRNAFAHGSFEVKTLSGGGEKIYLLESKKDDVVKAQMRLKESTLTRYIALSQLDATQVRALRKPKKKN